MSWVESTSRVEEADVKFVSGKAFLDVSYLCEIPSISYHVVNNIIRDNVTTILIPQVNILDKCMALTLLKEFHY